MITHVTLIGLACLGLAACISAPKAALATFSWSDIQPIVKPLTCREHLGRKCGAPNTAVKTAFMKDLTTAGASADTLAEAKAESILIERTERDTLKEYVCTIELVESNEKKSADAQAASAAHTKPKS